LQITIIALQENMLKFDIEKTIKYWRDGAKYDMDTAKALYEKTRYPYALFMGHLAIEKLLKALVVKNTKKHSPYTHSLDKLARKSKIDFPEEILIKLREFMEFHFEARYPSEQKAFYKKCTLLYTKAKMSELRKTYKWLKSQL